MPVRDAWYVGDEYWRNAYCADAGCCPLPGPSRRRDPRQPPQRRDGVPGSSVGAPPGADRSRTTSGRRRRIRPWRPPRSAGPASLPAGGPAGPSSRGSWTHGNGCSPPTAAAELPTEMAGFLRACLGVPSWRDAVLVMAAAGRPAAAVGAEEFGIFSSRAGLTAAGPCLSGPDPPAVSPSGPALAGPSAPAGRAEPDRAWGRADQGIPRLRTRSRTRIRRGPAGPEPVRARLEHAEAPRRGDAAAVVPRPGRSTGCGPDGQGMDRMVPGEGILRPRFAEPGPGGQPRIPACGTAFRSGPPRNHLRVGQPAGGGLAEIRHRRRLARRIREGGAGTCVLQPPAAMTGKTMRQWLPRPGWVRESVLAIDPETGTLRPPRQFYLMALPAAVAPDINHGLDRVIVVLPVW